YTRQGDPCTPQSRVDASALLARGHEPIDHSYNVLRASADANVFGQVDPADRAGRVDQKFGRPRDVAVVLACPRVQDTITADDLRVGIRKNRIAIALVIGKLPRFRRRIDADGRDCNSTRTKFLQVLFETP